MRRQGLFFLLLLLFSFVIVAFGHPVWIGWLGLVAGIAGYALFWKGMLMLPTAKKRFWMAAVWFAAVQAVQFFWVLSNTYIGAPAYPLYGILCLGMGLQFGLVCLLIPVSSPLTMKRIAVIASAWTLMEWGRLLIFTGFPWSPSGLVLSAHLFPLQTFSLWGIYGACFWVMFTNLLALGFLVTARRGLFGWTFVFAALFPYLFGFAYVTFYERQDSLSSPPTLSIALVQTALTPEQKSEAFSQGVSLSPARQWEGILKLLKKQQGSSLDMIILPEAVVPFGTDTPFCSINNVSRVFEGVLGSCVEKKLPPLEAPAAQLVNTPDGDVWAGGNIYFSQMLSNVFNTPVIVGLSSFDAAEVARDGKPHSYNAAFFLQPHAKHRLRYEKQLLLPMAEYIPLSWIKSFLASYGIFDSFTPGREAKVFQVKKIPFSISICSEDIYGDLIRKQRLLGSQLFVNISNDAWYPHSKLSKQHFALGRLRAVENGVPLVRSANAGVVGFVDRFGRVVQALDVEGVGGQWLSDSLLVQVPIQTHKTLYTYAGDVPVIALSIFCLAMFFLARFLKRTKQDKSYTPLS